MDLILSFLVLNFLIYLLWWTRTGKRLMGFLLALTGFLGIILISAIPIWKVTSSPYDSTLWEGLWMKCELSDTGERLCVDYDSFLILPMSDMEAAQTPVCMSIAVGFLAVSMSMLLARQTFYKDERLTTALVGLSVGIMFTLAGVLCFVSVSQAAYSITMGYHHPTASMKRKGTLGDCIYVGWMSGFLLVVGGGMICRKYRH